MLDLEDKGFALQSIREHAQSHNRLREASISGLLGAMAQLLKNIESEELIGITEMRASSATQQLNARLAFSSPDSDSWFRACVLFRLESPNYSAGWETFPKKLPKLVDPAAIVHSAFQKPVWHLALGELLPKWPQFSCYFINSISSWLSGCGYFAV